MPPLLSSMCRQISKVGQTLYITFASFEISSFILFVYVVFVKYQIQD